jgi:coniferyl-aldehyde dehydrogenase
MTTSLRPDDSATEAQKLFDIQHAASRRDPTPTLEARRDSLDKLKRLVADNDKAICAAISADFGQRSRHETQLLEIVPLLGAISHARKHVARWMKPEARGTDVTFQPAKSWIRYEPLGVIGIISPWNYPLLLALGPLVDVLAAGNRALLKPSELTPAFSAMFQELVSAHFPPEQVAVVTGGPDVAAAFSSLPFDHLVFTGSTAIGRRVMQAAAANLTPVTLELGGKSPAIVCADYPLQKAAASIAIGKFLNAGQTCIAPDYVLVPSTQVRAFADAVMAKVRKAYPTIADNPDYSAMISPRHRARLVEAVEAAAAAGATVLTHGDDAASGSRKIKPTVVIGAPSTSLLLAEEIFGPVLPIVPYDDLDAALATIRAGDRPLALYCFSNDAVVRDRVLDGATSGGVTLNGTLLHIAQNALPFGGVGASGIGAYHGRDGFRRFSHVRSVHKIGSFSAFEKLGPPWGRLASGMIAMMKKR